MKTECSVKEDETKADNCLDHKNWNRLTIKSKILIKLFLNWFELFTSWYVDVGGDPKIDFARFLVNQSMSAKLKHLNVLKYKYYEKLCYIHMAMT